MAIHTNVFFVLVLVLSETVLAVEGKLRNFVDKRAKYEGFSFPEKVIDLNRFRRFRVRVAPRIATIPRSVGSMLGIIEAERYRVQTPNRMLEKAESGAVKSSSRQFPSVKKRPVKHTTQASSSTSTNRRTICICRSPSDLVDGT